MGYPWSPGQVLTAADLNAAFQSLSSSPVRSFNTRTGAITLTTGDVTAALGYTPVQTVAGRTGAVTLTTSDLNDWSSAIASLAPLNSPHFVGTPTANTAAPGTSTTQLATTAFVAGAVTTGAVVSVAGRSGVVTLTHSDLTDWSSATTGFAPLASPTFTGTPTVPGYLTTATAASTYAPLASPTFTGTVTIPSGASIVGFAPLASPTFTGTVTIPSGASISGFAPLASPALTGTPTAPTATAGTTTTQLATTAFVAAAVTASTTGVASFNTRTGAITLTSSDVTTALTFTPYNATNPSGYQTAANVTTTLASPPAIGGTAAAAGSFTTLTASSTVSGAGFTSLLAPYAPLASPTFTGTPAAPTATAGTNTTQLATTQFVTSAVAAATTGVASFNTRTGAVTLTSGDVTTALTFTPYNNTNPSGYQTAANVTASLASYAPLASPTLTGTPAAPTATAGTNTTQLATTAFVSAALGGGGASSTPSTSQTLTSASSRAQSYAFTAAGLTVTLPDATTLSTGGPIFSLYNAGGYTFGVLRNGGTLLTAVPPGASADCYLDSAGTAAGTWHATGQGLQSAFELLSNTLSGAVVASTTTLLGFIGAVAIFWQGSSTGLQAFDTSGGTVGSVATLTSAATNPVLLPIDSTHGLIVYFGSSNICAQVLSLSGTTITVNTQATISTGTPTSLAAAVTLTTGSSYLVAYNVSANSSAVQLGVSGTTVTFGTAVSTAATAVWATTRPLSVISSTQVLGVVNAATSACRVIGISGSTVTMNTAANAISVPTIVLALSTTLFLLCEGTSGLQAVSVSGTTCTAGTQNTSFGSTAWTAGQWAASGTSFILANAASPGVLYYGTISGTTITLAASLTVATNWAPGANSAAITLANDALFAVSSGYIYVQSEGVMTASGSAFSLAEPDLWPDQMVVSGSVALQDGSGGVMLPVAAGDGFTSIATAQTSGNLLIKPGRVYPVGGYTAALSGAISAGKFVVGTSYPGRTAPTGTGAQWRVGVWQLAT